MRVTRSGLKRSKTVGGKKKQPQAEKKSSQLIVLSDSDHAQSQSHSSFEAGAPLSEDIEAKERKQNFLSMFTPSKIVRATIETPVKLFWGGKDSPRKSQRPHKSYGQPWVAAALGVVLFCASMATINSTVKVPEKNFWVKTVDCQAGDEYCSFQDVTCTSRDVNHHCTDPFKEWFFYNEIVEGAKLEISRLGACSEPWLGRTFELNEQKLNQEFDDKVTPQALKALLEKNHMLSRRFSLNGFKVTFKQEMVVPKFVENVCKIQQIFNEGISLCDKSLYPFYLVLAFLVSYLCYRGLKGGPKLAAERLNRMIVENLGSDKFRNGIRSGDIWKYFKKDIIFNAEEFEQKVLPILTDRLKRDSRVKMELNRSGTWVWKLDNGE